MKKGILIQFYIAMFCAILVSFSVYAQSSGDVKIGKQIWMSKNLDVDKFRNGIAIPEAKNAKQWAKAGKNKTAAWCYYENNGKNGKVYGKLYNWFAVSDSSGLAPIGYHIPSDAEWTILTDFLGGVEIALFKMKSTSGWYNGGNGDNSSRFNGLPGGFCNYNGYFYDITGDGLFWSSSEFSANYAWDRDLNFNKPIVYRDGSGKYNGLSVRCIKD